MDHINIILQMLIYLTRKNLEIHQEKNQNQKKGLMKFKLLPLAASRSINGARLNDQLVIIR